jgi:hypothetical protein
MRAQCRNVVTILERIETRESTDGGRRLSLLLRVCPHIVEYKKGERPTHGLRIRPRL